MMNQTIQHTTQKLIDLLPENEQYYGLDELRNWGYPSFIVQRIQVELERNLAESMILPATDWANTQSDAVRNAWHRFVQAIRAEARLPASYAKAVIETAVADTLDMLLEPRKNIPDIIFGSDNELEYEQLCDRMEAVVVFRHFAALVPRYMQKKELDTLSRERCEQLIRRADERMTHNYSPLNWAQTLDPLFVLLDEQIEPSMLRLFFEDKERKEMAELFDREDEPLNRAQFIEILSSPAWVEPKTASSKPEPVEPRVEEPAEPEEMATTDAGATGQKYPTVDENAGLGQKNEEEPRQREEEPVEDPEEEEKIDEKERFIREQGLPAKESSQNAASDEPASSDQEPALNGDDDSSTSLNAAFGWDEEGYQPIDDDSDAEMDSNDGVIEGYADEAKEEEEAFEKTGYEAEDMAEPSSQWEDPAEEEGEEKPIWMNFMSDEEKAALESAEEPKAISETGSEEGKSYQETDEDAYMDEPIFDLTNEDAGRQEANILKKQLSEGRSRFVEDIFGGSEQAYEEAVEEIAMAGNWRAASNYIQNEIFKRNMVDMYSESAIDFTDRLHSYFSKK